MIARSPAPQSRVRRTWLWIAMAAGVAAVILVSVAVTYPWWSASWVQGRLEQRLEARLQQPVVIDALEVQYGGLELEGVEVGELVTLDRLQVQVANRVFWPLNPKVQTVVVEGGEIRGSRRQWQDLWDVVRGPGGPAGGSADGARKRDGRIPEFVTMRDLAIDVEGFGPQPGVVQGVLQVSARPRSRKAEITVSDVRLGLAGADVHVERIFTEVHPQARGDDIRFPLRLQIESASAALTDHIALAAVDGEITIDDARLETFAIDLNGSFSDRAASERAAEADDGKLWSLRGTVRRDRTAGNLKLEMQAFELGRVPQVLTRLPLVDSENAIVGGQLQVAFSGGAAQLEGNLKLEGLQVRHPLLANATVPDVGFEMEFSASLDPAEYTVVLQRLQMRRKGVTLEVDGRLVHPPERTKRQYHVRARVAPVPCQDVLDAIPQELIPSLEGFRLGGRFDLDVGLDVNYDELEQLDLFGSVGLWNCRIERAPPRVSSLRLGGPFVHRVALRDGSERVIRLFPGSGTFTPLEAISPYMTAAVLTTEDGGFYRHRGFLPSQFETALRRNLKAGEIRLGASTITMQMVKNVLLSHERTLSRKLQEMFLTWYVEQSLTKDRIMEIYLNVVEYGPGIYGVTRAAEHYFAKHPRDLNPLESMYLALMLPSPVRRHVHYCRGELSPRMDAKLRRLLKIAHARDNLEELDYELWKDVPLTFDLQARGSEEQCMERIARLLEGTRGQEALTGLLQGSDVESLNDPVFPSMPAGTAFDSQHPPAADDGTAGMDQRPLPSLVPQSPSDVDATGTPAMEQDTSRSPPPSVTGADEAEG